MDSREGLVRGLLSRLETVADSPWFGYGSIALIQLKVMWDVWLYRDLTGGDTAFYYTLSQNFAQGLELNPAWSPLYLIFFGSLSWVAPDAYDVTILHRVLIAVTASLLVLAVLRRLLPAGIAWLMALWWALIPTNYDALYEVHLFSIIPALGAVLVAIRYRSLTGRAVVFGLLLLNATLVRNEMIVAAGAWALAWGGYELWRWRKRGVRERPQRLALAVGAPVAVVLALQALVLWSYSDDAGGAFKAKETLNVCNVYTFGYEQRYDDFSGDPFTECGRLMLRDFGERAPSLREAWSENPDAMVETYAWNASLIPHGLELMLFSEISGDRDHNPDYVPVPGESSRALIGLIVLLAVLATGLTILISQRRYWWAVLIRERAWGWIALGCFSVTGVTVMVMQRPRPSYLFATTVLLLALIGLSLYVIGYRWPRLGHLRAAIPVAAVAVLLLVPSHYDDGYETPQQGRGRPLLTMSERLQPFAGELGDEDVLLLAERFPRETCSYIAEAERCVGLEIDQRIDDRQPGYELRDMIAEFEVDYFYVDETIGGSPAMRREVRRLEREGWEVLSPDPAERESWALLRGPDGASDAPSSEAREEQEQPSRGRQAE